MLIWVALGLLTALTAPGFSYLFTLPALAAAIAFNILVIDRLLGLDRLFQAAVMTMAVLPPPFVVPLYMARARGRDVTDDPDHDYLANTLSLATIVTLAAITVVGVVYAT